MLPLPPDFEQRMRNVFGPAGRDWLARLPSLIRACEEKWSIEATGPRPDLSYNYVTGAVREDGSRVMLKMGVPHRELYSEMKTLEAFGGDGCVRLLQSDRDLGAMLLEYVVPGTPLSKIEDDEEATRIACDVLRRLHRPPPENSTFRTVAQRAKDLEKLRARFDGGTGPFPTVLVEKAERFFEALIASTTEEALLHGDFHHDNILHSDRDGWIVIDAKGVIADPVYEISTFLFNPLRILVTVPRPKRLLERRVDIFAAELGLDRQRILSWGLCHSILSAWWSIEDNTDGASYTIACAELMDSLLG